MIEGQPVEVHIYIKKTTTDTGGHAPLHTRAEMAPPMLEVEDPIGHARQRGGLWHGGIHWEAEGEASADGESLVDVAEG